MIQQAVGNTNDNVIQQQLDAIKKQGLRANEQELNLLENYDLYNGLHENGISKEELARRIIDQRNIADSKDYFSDTEQIQKANSYANYIIQQQSKSIEDKSEEHQEEMVEAKKEAEEEKQEKLETLNEQLQTNETQETKEENKNTPKEEIKENTENTEEKITITKNRYKESIGKYIDKIKALKTANEEEKTAIRQEMEAIKAEIKTDKEKYDQVKRDFFATTKYNVENFTTDDLKKVPTKRYRFETRKGKLFNAPKRNNMRTIRRNMTIRKLIGKFNKIGDKPKDGVRFVMGFEKARFLRYTGIKINTAIDKAGSGMGMQMNPQQFHTAFNAGRKAIFAILNMDTGESAEQKEESEKMISALKKRINYYGYAYARERANARVTPFVEAEKTAKDNERILEKTETKKAKVIQMNPPQQKKATA